MTDDTASFGTCASTLLKAAGTAGGIEALARHLRVPKKQLGSWMDGEVETPWTVFLRARDFLRGARAATPARLMNETPLQAARAGR
jgi:hypothetical protein